MRSAFIVASLTFVAVACEDPPAAPASDAGAPETSVASSTSSTAAPDRELQPVYPLDDKPPHPVAQQYCDAVYDLEAARSSECCGTKDTMAAIKKECVRTLSWAMHAGAMTATPEAITACSEALTKALEGCEWVGPKPPPLPDGCMSILKGTVAEGQLCRSSLECSGDMHCFGLGAIRPGKCGKRLPNGKSCGASVDTLATFTRQSRFEEDHPVCAGVCTERKCSDQVPSGGACNDSRACGAGNFCKAGKCAEGRGAAVGEPCPNRECDTGLRCVEGTCATPRASGEKCTVDDECWGRCAKGAGEKEGVCEKRCPTAAQIPQLQPGAGSAKPNTKGRKVAPQPKK